MHTHSLLVLFHPILPHQPGLLSSQEDRILPHTRELSIRASIAEYKVNKMVNTRFEPNKGQAMTKALVTCACVTSLHE
jgi:hypothetical protein